MITSQRVAELTDKVVALNQASSDQSWAAKTNRMWRVIDGNCGKDIRQKMFKAIQAEMTRRSAARRTAQATARTAIGKRA
jgi:hypothetical protein